MKEHSVTVLWQHGSITALTGKSIMSLRCLHLLLMKSTATQSLNRITEQLFCVNLQFNQKRIYSE